MKIDPFHKTENKKREIGESCHNCIHCVSISPHIQHAFCGLLDGDVVGELWCPNWETKNQVRQTVESKSTIFNDILQRTSEKLKVNKNV